MTFGAHMSISGGISKAFARGVQTGCEVMQIFSKNERQWVAKPYPPEEIAAYKAEQARTGIGPVLVHGSYLINLATADDSLWRKSITAFADELERCALLDIPYLIVHPGAHTNSSEEVGLQREIEALNHLFEMQVGVGVTILLETTAGQGTALGRRFEQIAHIIELTRYPERVGVCVDTCHIFAAGYDIRTTDTYTATFTEFDRVIGLEWIKAFHLNDSQKDLGSRVDRHTHIGQGCLGVEPFRLLINDTRFTNLPMIIETPKGKDMVEDIENLTLLRSLKN